MSDPVSMSLDDYIKSQKRTGKMSYGRGGGRGGPKGNGSRGSGGGGPKSSGGGGGAQRTPRGRRGRPSFNNVQRRRGNGSFNGGGRNRQFPVAGSGFPRGNRVRGGGVVQGQGPIRNNMKRRNRNRQVRRPRNSGVQQGGSGQQQVGAGNFRYFKGNSAVAGGAAVGLVTPKRNQARRVRANRVSKVALNRQAFVVPNRNTKRAVQKLAKKRVQRAKLLVSRLKGGAGVGRPKKLISTSGRVALGKNGFVTVRNSNAKRMERALVQMKIARAQKARNRLQTTPPQRTVNFAGPSTSSGGRRRNRSARRTTTAMSGGSPLDWNTSIVRTMTNDLADEMSSSHLNPEIQRKIAFIQSRSKSDRAPVMPDFRAPVTTSRMKLSDRFRLINDQ